MKGRNLVLVLYSKVEQHYIIVIHNVCKDADNNLLICYKRYHQYCTDQPSSLLRCRPHMYLCPMPQLTPTNTTSVISAPSHLITELLWISTSGLTQGTPLLHALTAHFGPRTKVTSDGTFDVDIGIFYPEHFYLIVYICTGFPHYAYFWG